MYFCINNIQAQQNLYPRQKEIMTHIEIWLMALALAMDCFAVSIASGIIFKRVIWKPMLTMAVLFGFFQALNPFLGWALLISAAFI